MTGGESRTDAIRAFLKDAGFGTARLDWLAADASFRRYGRLTGGPAPALIMDAPSEREDVRPWLAVTRHLRDLGFSAPDVLAADAAAGLLLIEDFGEDTFTRLLARGADETALYDLAIDVLAELHELPAARTVPAWLPPYDTEKLLAEVALLADWYLPALIGTPMDESARTEFLELWRAAFDRVSTVPTTLVLRDYHVDNLMRVPGRDGVRACGLLDFQDAVAGHPAYDLVSLLEDARRDLGVGIARHACNRYFAARGDIDRDEFETSCAVLGAARSAKIIGIFTRLCVRDGKARYLDHIPRVWRLLERDLAHPALADVRAWTDRAVAPEERRVPSRLAARS